MRTFYIIALFLVFSLNTNINANTSITTHIANETCNLPAPLNLKVTGVISKSISISWDAVSGANSYIVTVSEAATTIIKYNNVVLGNSLSISDLKSKTEYSIKVSAIDPSGCNSPYFSKIDYVILDEAVVQRLGKTYDINDFNPIVSPNPFTEELSIFAELFAGKNAALFLYDANGRLLKTQQMGEETQKATINTSDLSPGMYFLRFQNDTTAKTYKLMKMSW
jgi:hypothetical protein